MTYSTPLKQKLALGLDDVKEEGKLVRLMKDLEGRILTPVPGAIDWRFCEADMSDAAALAADTGAWAGFTQRTVWSRDKGHTWFAARVTVPEEARGRTFVLRFSSQWQERPGSTDPQCLAHIDGKIAQAIDGNHTELVVMRQAVPGRVFDLRVNAFTWFDRPLAGFGVEYLVRDERVEALYHDLMTPFEVAKRLHQTDPRRHAIFGLVDDALRALDRRGKTRPGGLEEAEAIAARIYDLQDTELQPKITAFGHTHLDVAWLWRVLHVRQKTGRSFATILKLIEEFPDFIVMYNQAVLFDFLKTDYPDLWEGVKAAVKTGQWDIEGAMWVEPDANIVSGESMVRQILWGRRFHMTEFGVTPRCVWLPDTFGYSANMPQIIQKSGLNYFLTSKLSWNDTDRHPYDTFWWKGIDGTETKAHLITAQKFESEEIFTTYNSDLSVSEVMGSWKRYEPKAVHDELALCYGYGDGGGGPTRAMIARGQRLSRGIPGAPKVRLEGLGAFLDRLGPEMEGRAGDFPRWNGELYLQYHRGTLTNVAKNKKNNRDAERVLREVEMISAIALAQAGHPWPAADLDRLWRIVLINQFHDILPGTSIPEVYEDSDRDYAELFATAHGGNGLMPAALAATSAQGQVVNFTGRTRDGLVVVPEGSPGQAVTRADGSRQTVARALGVPALGWGGRLTAEASGLSVGDRHLENDLLRVTFDDAGEIVSVLDKTRGREVLTAPSRLVAYEDKSMNWDAWDIDWYYDQQFWPLGAATISVAETGPLRAALRIERPYLSSKVVQVVSLEAGAAQVEFDTFIDWHERHHVLKAEFDFDLNVSEMRSEIQFGHVTRPTHRNTTWDRARFEASMHRWVDMSEPDFGVALVNDCKYACSAKEQTIGLTLVRGATHPHPLADEGEHRLRYALRPHAGTSDLETVHHAAEAFNNPLVLHGAPQAGTGFSFASSDAGNVALETLKRAEDGQGFILRLYEHANRRAAPTITFGLPVKSVRLVNLMEEEPSAPLTLTDNGVTLTLRPFEIATLRIEV